MPVVLVIDVALLCSMDVVDSAATVDVTRSVLSVFDVVCIVSINRLAADVAVSGSNVLIVDVCAPVVFA